MDTYDKKYGFDSTSDSATDFHKQRVMFAIKDGAVFLAPIQSADSHAKWFESLGWISPDSDSLMNELTRGYVDASGVYAYTGYDFANTDRVKRELLKHLPEISKRLKVPANARVFLGLNKTDWTPRLCLGTLDACLSK
jgi:hypothetical protein